MPKVSEEYIANKRREIVSAAHRLCLAKPVSMVTMTDIIKETGMAQGGIYRYFEDIDDIFREMILDMRESYSIKEDLDDLFSHASEMGVEAFTDSICDLLADRMESQLMDIQKINFDLSVMTINEPERTAKILGGIDSEGNLEYLVNRSAMLIGQARSEGKLNPSLPLEDIISYIAAAYSGIQMTCIIGACYRSSPMGGYEPRKLFKVLAQSIKSLLCQ